MMSNENICEFETSSDSADDSADDCNELQEEISNVDERNQRAMLPAPIGEGLQNQLSASSLVSTSGPVIFVGEKYVSFNSSS